MRLAAGLAVLAIAAPAAADPEPVRVPAARAGDAWQVDVGGDPYAMRAVGVESAVDRLGRVHETLAIEVDGFHPVAWEAKEVTRHVMHVALDSGVQVTDVTSWLFGGMPGEPAAYVSSEPNNPDGWPGWVLAGGLLAGRVLHPGDTVEVPLVMSQTRGADSITMTIHEAPTSGWGRCVWARGSAHYPVYAPWTGGEHLVRSLDLALETLQCEGSPYALETRLTWGAPYAFTTETRLVSLERGTGDAVRPGPYDEPATHVLGAATPFDGRLRDGGTHAAWSIEAAQEAAALAPGLLGWRLLHPDGYLVEARYEPSVAAGGERWSLVFADPSRARHEVWVDRRAGIATALDVPQPTDYPAPVPELTAWPDRVVTPAGVLAAWRQLAGPDATFTGMRWQPLLDHRWYVMGEVHADCSETGCNGTVGMEMAFRFDSGAAETGEIPLP